MDSMISDEAVEAAAKAMWGGDDAAWQLQIQDVRDSYLEDARKALEAAAPYMLDRERIAVLIAEYGNELVGSSGGPEHLEYTYADAILGVAE